MLDTIVIRAADMIQTYTFADLFISTHISSQKKLWKLPLVSLCVCTIDTIS